MTQLLFMIVAAAGIGYLVRGPSAAVAVLLVGAVVLAYRLRQHALWMLVLALVAGDIAVGVFMRALRATRPAAVMLAAPVARW